eukprot:762800-Hanusia_phi.AAC.1
MLEGRRGERGRGRGEREEERNDGGDETQEDQTSATEATVQGRISDSAYETEPYKIKVSKVKNSNMFYLALCKRVFLVKEVLELSGSGTEMSTAITISEILRNSGVAERLSEYL